MSSDSAAMAVAITPTRIERRTFVDPGSTGPMISNPPAASAAIRPGLISGRGSCTEQPPRPNQQRRQHEHKHGHRLGLLRNLAADDDFDDTDDQAPADGAPHRIESTD